jgi:hypothetical protein
MCVAYGMFYEQLKFYFIFKCMQWDILKITLHIFKVGTHLIGIKTLKNNTVYNVCNICIVGIVLKITYETYIYLVVVKNIWR